MGRLTSRGSTVTGKSFSVSPPAEGGGLNGGVTQTKNTPSPWVILKPRRSTWPRANKEATGRQRNPKRRRSKSLPQHQAKRVRDGNRPSLRAKGNRNG